MNIIINKRAHRLFIVTLTLNISIQKQLIWPTFNPFSLNIVDLPIKTNIMLLSSFNTSRQGNTSTLHSRMMKVEAVITIQRMTM